MTGSDSSGEDSSSMRRQGRSGDRIAWTASDSDINVPGTVRRANVVLDAPNLESREAMPLGNGRLGTAVWAENGYIAQLNRGDTYPDMKSAGRVSIPGIADDFSERDFDDQLDLYDATLRQSIGDLTVETYVHAERDVLVVNVAGADPDEPLTGTVSLWDDRDPESVITGSAVALAETFDGTDPEREKAGIFETDSATFGFVGALTALGRDVTTEYRDDRTLEVTVEPRTDGTCSFLAVLPRFSN